MWLSSFTSNFDILFYQFAGAINIATLLVMPAAAGLFHRVMWHSGTTDASRPDRAYAVSAAMAAEPHIGCSSGAPEEVLACLRNASVAQLQAAAANASLTPVSTAIIDGAGGSVPGPPLRLLLAGNASGLTPKVSLLVLETAHEADYFLPCPTPPNCTADAGTYLGFVAYYAGLIGANATWIAQALELYAAWPDQVSSSCCKFTL
jgi:carboxylesterase type B